MRTLFELVFGTLGGVAFLCAGIAIFVWDIGKLQQAHDSRGWPQAQGVIIESGIDKSQREHRPRVAYTYVVAGRAYTSNQISFDVFDKPGGQGRLESIVARYPVGQEVIVYHHPDDPAVTILEPEDYSPFLQPLLFGVLFLFGGVLTLVMVVRQLIYGRPAPRQGVSEWRIFACAVFISVLIYSILIIVSLGSGPREISVLAFGPRPLEIPNLVFILGLQTILYLPMPWVFWHATRVTIRAQQHGSWGGIGYLMNGSRSHPDLRRSRLVCIGGLLYFVAIGGAWIVYTAILGI